jgi:hypothetical protein
MKTIPLLTSVALFSSALLVACSSSDTTGAAGAATGGSAGVGAGGSAGVSASGSAGVGTGGSAGVGTGGSAGVGGGSGDCPKGDQCTMCCGQKDPASGLLLEQTAVQCACGDAGKCTTQCAATMCQVPSQQPDPTCNSCTQLGCFAAINAACTSEACKKVMACMVQCSL